MDNFLELQEKIGLDNLKVYRKCQEALNRNPEDGQALFLWAKTARDDGMLGISYQLVQRLLTMNPQQGDCWSLLGAICHDMHRYIEAKTCFKQALTLNPDKASDWGNLALINYELGAHDKAIFCANQGLGIDINSKTCWRHLALAQFAIGDWANGFLNYDVLLDGKNRRPISYKGEPQWDGTPNQSVVIYGEQGIGDEIMFASMIDQAAHDCSELIIECDERLEGLFKRSFTQHNVNIYGQRRQNVVVWKSDHPVDASCPIATLGRFYRKSDADFPGKPYLVPDPERVVQWKALFKSWGKHKPVIGLTWSGGIERTNKQARQVPLEAYRPLIESRDAYWVSLQYNGDPEDEICRSGLPIRHFYRATNTDDYDDTAGLVAALDMIVSVPTSVVHLAGALGVKTHVMVPEFHDWRWARDVMPWHESIKIYRKAGSWEEFIKKLTGVIKIR